MPPLLPINVPITRTSLAEAVYETLLECIVTGQLASGTELSELALAEQFDVSRTPVHDALRRLAYDGLVEQQSNRKARVARFTPDEMVEVYGMRSLLEAGAAALAAKRLSDDQLSEMRRAADALAAAEDEVDWPARAIEFDLWFHGQIAQAAGNRRLERDIGRYRQLIRGLCRMTGTRANLRAALAEHLAVLAALEARDAAAARDAMSCHIEARLESVLQEMQPRPASS